MEKYKTGVSDLDLLKHQITNSDPSEIDAIVELRPQVSVISVEEEEEEKEEEKEEKKVDSSSSSVLISSNLDPQQLHIMNDKSIIKDDSSQNDSLFAINSIINQTLLVIDNFYENPDKVRNFALQQEFIEDTKFYRGKRTKSFMMPHQEHVFGLLLGTKIKNWEEHTVNGCFQIQDAEDSEVIHMDKQQFGGVIYLTPNAPLDCGTSLYQSRLTGIRSKSELQKKPKEEQDNIFNRTFEYGFFDKSKFDEVDRIGNVYNRLILFSGQNIHAVTNTFGNNNNNCRLFQIFFFDLKEPE